MSRKIYNRRCNSMFVMSQRYKPSKVPERLRHEAVVLMGWARVFKDSRSSMQIIGYPDSAVQKWRDRHERKAS